MAHAGPQELWVAFARTSEPATGVCVDIPTSPGWLGPWTSVGAMGDLLDLLVLEFDFPPGSWRTKGQDWGWAQGKRPQQTSLLENILLRAMQRCCPGAYGHSSAIFGVGWRICCFPLTHLFSLLAGRSQHQNCSVTIRINPVLQQQ